MTLKLGIELPYTETHDRDGLIALAREAEALGYDSVWASELYSFDAFTTLTQIATATDRIKLGTNIANIYARTPAMLAGTAASLDQLSGGRFILGIGVSGPQVIEGWHGVPYDKPIRRTRETIDIVRKVLAGDKLVYEGEVFNLTQGLRLLNKPLRPDMPDLRRVARAAQRRAHGRARRRMAPHLLLAGPREIGFSAPRWRRGAPSARRRSAHSR